MRRVQAVARTRSVTVAAGNRVAGGWRALRRLCVGFPRGALAAGLVVAAVGWVAARQLSAASGTERLLPSGAAERADARPCGATPDRPARYRCWSRRRT